MLVNPIYYLHFFNLKTYVAHKLKVFEIKIHKHTRTRTHTILYNLQNSLVAAH